MLRQGSAKGGLTRSNSMRKGLRKGAPGTGSSKALTSGGMGAAPGNTVRTRVAVVSDEELLPESKYSMLEFARLHFRMGHEMYEMQRTETGSIRGTVKMAAPGSKGKKKRRKEGEGLEWSWSELVALVKFSKSPIQASLLRPEEEDPVKNKLALENFLNVMRFMGDYPSKGKNEMDVIRYMLTTAMRYEDLRDEIYCQLLKQLTSNRSERAESCARGWRLLLILTAFIRPSSRLEPYLKSFLQNYAFTLTRDFHNEAAVCLRNLNQTLKHDGRQKLPSPQEVQACLLGAPKCHGGGGKGRGPGKAGGEARAAVQVGLGFGVSPFLS
jgi:myosin-15